MRTANQLLYEAYLNTPKPIPIPNGNTRVWPIPEIHEVPDALCWLCGGATNGIGRRHKDVIRKTFTNTPHARATNSTHLCAGCGWMLAQRLIRGFSLLLLDGQFFHPSKPTIRDLLLEPPKVYPWLLSIAVSGKKHISFLSKVNWSGKNLAVLYEQTPVYIGTGLEEIRLVEHLYNGEFTKAEILSGEYRQDRIKKFGLKEWCDAEEKIKPLRGSRVLELAVYVAQKGGNL